MKYNSELHLTKRIGIFYNTLDDYKKGLPSKIGYINEYFECVAPVQPEIGEQLIGEVWDEMGDSLDEKELLERIPNYALSVLRLEDNPE